MRLKATVVAALTALSLAVGAAPAAAQTNQTGLVNISLTNTTVQVPIGIAANVCDVTVGVLATVVQNGTRTDCTAVSTATVPVTVGTPPAGATNQTGLVNVSLTNTTIQVPIAAAINLCGVNVAILAVLQQTAGGASCDAIAHSSSG
jgi:hypothetical protein